MKDILKQRQLTTTTDNEISDTSYTYSYTRDEIAIFSYTTQVSHVCIQQPHRHEFYEFALILEASCMHSIDGQKPTELSRGDLFLVTPKNYHQLRNIPKTHKHRDFYVSTEKMERICKAFNFDFLNELPMLARVFRKKLTDSQIVALEEKALYFNSNIYTFPNEILEDIHTSIIVELLGYVLQTKHEKFSHRPDWITLLIQRLDNREFVLSSVEDIVKTTGYAHGYVCRRFKKHVGQTLLSYNNTIKLRESIKFLMSNTVLQTASILGWDNPKNYNIAFKKLYGVTPSQYKKSLQDQL